MKANEIIFLDEVDSTNRYLKDLIQTEAQAEQLLCVVGRKQIAGRGQKGNTWFATETESLTFSFIFKIKDLSPHKQFIISQLSALGLYRSIKGLLSIEQAKNLKIKWPNDLYYQDKKLAGMLIEHSLTGKRIDYSIVGIGLNLNHLSFPKELPNPISLQQITGQGYKVEAIITKLMQSFEEMLEKFANNEEELHAAYMHELYWAEGFHKFEDKAGELTAQIYGILPNGELILEREDGTKNHYDIKDVQFKH